MKKLFLPLIFCFLFLSCASNNVSKDPFIVKYNDIKDVTYITHENMKPGMIYNLRDSLSGERENIRVYIANKDLFLSVNYQYNNWAFFSSAVFLANNTRLKINFDNRTSEIVTGKIVREQYDSVLSEDNIDILLNMLSSNNIQVAFTGEKFTSDKFSISPKIAVAMIDTIKKYYEIKN